MDLKKLIHKCDELVPKVWKYEVTYQHRYGAFAPRIILSLISPGDYILNTKLEVEVEYDIDYQINGAIATLRSQLRSAGDSNV
ncbi:hypothetical protein VP150E351_P0129 [Vibrio phage 150E35-1]|nr:hypothetical protein VP150E351_P0129 [Vibrio phage 150E35-1]